MRLLRRTLSLNVSTGSFWETIRVLPARNSIHEVSVAFKPAHFIKLVYGVYVSPLDENAINFFLKNVVFLDEKVDYTWEKLNKGSFVRDFICCLSSVTYSFEYSGS